MANQQASNVENNFTKGLVTQFTGLNFPENAVTECDNTTFTLTGEVLNRMGIDLEVNGSTSSIDRTNNAVNTYKWNNAGDDSDAQLEVGMIGSNLHFWSVTDSTVASPLSDHKLSTVIDLTPYVVSGETFDTSICAEFADGNGFLFVFHPDIDPIYCEYSGGVVTATVIEVRIRDFIGAIDNLNSDTRPTELSAAHQYNLQNQGWAGTPAWVAQSTFFTPGPVFGVVSGTKVFTVAIGITGISPGQSVSLAGRSDLGTIQSGTGTVVSYGGSSLTITLSSGMIFNPSDTGSSIAWDIAQSNTGKIGEWFADMGNYPSNADQWWRFKTSAEIFDPATTAANVTLGTGDAPRGHYIYSAFNIDRSATSTVAGITAVNTTSRPSNGCWHQGRVWFTGVHQRQIGSDTTDPCNWTENIYFSQIVLSPKNFGRCYQENDPTNEGLFDLLPSDGGVITLQGLGKIFKLFPIANGIIVFASNGIRFITGKQGIGFTANDYTVVEISDIKSISSTSFVNVQGMPYFWNEEGIYMVKMNQTGSLDVMPITFNTILKFYSDIPLSAKLNARGAYHPIDYTIQWIYRSTDYANTTERYSYDRILNFNVPNKAFYPYSIDNTNASINGIFYMSGPGGSTTPPPQFKYIVSYPDAGSYLFSFADEHSDTYTDWSSVSAVDYDCFFITGYKLHGQAQKRFQVPYIYVFSNTDKEYRYKIQGMWDAALTSDSNRFSTAELAIIEDDRFSMKYKRHKIRGRGIVLQLKVTSVPGKPFNLLGWSTFESINSGV